MKDFKGTDIGELGLMAAKEAVGVKVVAQVSAIKVMQIIATIQLASRHPTAGTEEPVQAAVEWAKEVQALFGEGTAIHAVLEMGWDQDLDVPPNWSAAGEA